MMIEKYYTDENGIRYRRHGVRSRLFGYSYRDAYYPVAEDDPKRFLYVTLFLGIFGGHKFMAGEYGQGLMYLLTCGGFGVFYVSDVLGILTENYCITQVSYEEDPDGGLVRKKLRIFLDKVRMGALWKGLVFGAAVLIGVCSMSLGYTRFLVWVDQGIEETVDAYVRDYGRGTEFIKQEEAAGELSQRE